MRKSLQARFYSALVFAPIVILFSVVLVPSLGWADVEIGASAIAQGGLFAAGLFLIPWFSEALVYSLYLPGRFRDMLLPSFLSNLASSFAGLFVFSILSVIKIKVLFYVLELVISVLIEYPIVTPFFKNFDRPKRWRSVILANAASYALILVYKKATKWPM